MEEFVEKIKDNRFLFQLSLSVFGVSLIVTALSSNYYVWTKVVTVFAGVYVATVSLNRIFSGSYKEMESGPKWVSFLMVLGALLMLISATITALSFI